MRSYNNNNSSLGIVKILKYIIFNSIRFSIGICKRFRFKIDFIHQKLINLKSKFYLESTLKYSD